MKRRVVRAAMTQTVNVYRPMPASIAELKKLEGKLEELRRANVEHHVGLLAEAKKQGARVVCFGELFPAPYFALGEGLAMWRALAEDAESGPTVKTLREAAKANGTIVVAPIYEAAKDGKKRFNTAVVIDHHGRILGTYRKTHIPYGKNEQGSFTENFYYERSDGDNGESAANVSKNRFFPVFKTAVGRIGIATCYDRHFEGVMSTLKAEGAEIVFSPAVTFGEKSRRMWPLEFAVDAARHGVFIGGSNRKGSEPPWSQPYFGETHFVGPNGPLANLSTHDELVIADLDLTQLEEPDPSGWNLPRDTRADIYAKRG